MKKIGILSLYYDNGNYGGLLQAYALEKAINNLGFSCEQICYDYKHGKNRMPSVSRKQKLSEWGIPFLLFICYNRINKLLHKNNKNIHSSPNDERIELRTKAFKNFEQNEINHSQLVYTDDNIADTNEIYDGFVCGSDQIWNPYHITDTFMLGFAEENKIKISYAASISRSNIVNDQRQYICDRLNRFDRISVREKSAIELINSKEFEIEAVPDPTFLLDEHQWNELIEEKDSINPIKDKYVFCYLLGASKKQREIIQNVANKKGWKLAGFPHVQGRYEVNDECIKYDYELFDCSPKDFLRIIRDSEYVITDSFHAVVFSIIYRKNFSVFRRERTCFENQMSSRLVDLLGDFGLIDRIIRDSEHDLYNSISHQCDFSNANSVLEKYRRIGSSFLKKALSIEKK